MVSSTEDLDGWTQRFRAAVLAGDAAALEMLLRLQREQFSALSHSSSDQLLSLLQRHLALLEWARRASVTQRAQLSAELERLPHLSAYCRENETPPQSWQFRG